MKQTETIVLRGNIVKVFHAGPKFSAGRLETVEGEVVSFAGNLFAVEGESVALVGMWDKHPTYGRQFKVSGVNVEMPSGAKGLARFIANHPDVHGIGPARAEKIARALGDDFERVLIEEPERVAEIAKVPLTTIENLQAVWLKARDRNAAMTWLAAFELTHHQVSTLVEKLGNNALAILKADPYRVIGEVKGLGFKKVDQIARKMGTAKEHAPRLRAGILHCLQEALGQGDCWIEREDLLGRAGELMVMDCLDGAARIDAELDALIRLEGVKITMSDLTASCNARKSCYCRHS